MPNYANMRDATTGYSIMFHNTQASAKVERPTTRKQTRGSAVKKSVHVTGISVVLTEFFVCEILYYQ